VRRHFLYCAFAFGFGPNDGWFNYVPLAARAYNGGPNIDFYSLGMILLGHLHHRRLDQFRRHLSALRAPGMSINRVPILVWGTLTASAANIFAIPAVSLAFFLLWMDRNLGTHFFDVTAGGSTAAVAASVLDVRPSLGLCHRAARHGHGVGRPARILPPAAGRLHRGGAGATVATMVLGFGVWVHHMFATGLPSVSLSFFSAASIIIAVPSAVGVFAWIATIWTGGRCSPPPSCSSRASSCCSRSAASRLHDRARCRWTGSSPTPISWWRTSLCADRHQRVSRWWARPISGFQNSPER
jgi:cytochrome c oxidase subunit I+III